MNYRIIYKVISKGLSKATLRPKINKKCEHMGLEMSPFCFIIWMACMQPANLVCVAAFLFVILYHSVL